ncbi:MAG TPA: ORF6N domain-containing protein [Bacteroidia bacterium]|nr:ORF6N domain-containing protein [Bacteroidia bacterium]
MGKLILLTEENILNKIYLIRGKKVMLDSDLAKMYGVKVKVLNQSVKRNMNRFPEDFMFQLLKAEHESLRSQFVTLKRGQHSKFPPYAFTEQGVAMLSSILKSETAVQVNIQIIRVFTRMRELLSSHKDVLLKLEQIEKKLLKHDHLHKKNEQELQAVFEALKQLLNPAPEKRNRVGYRLANDKN